MTGYAKRLQQAKVIQARLMELGLHPVVESKDDGEHVGVRISRLQERLGGIVLLKTGGVAYGLFSEEARAKVEPVVAEVLK